MGVGGRDIARKCRVIRIMLNNYSHVSQYLWEWKFIPSKYKPGHIA